jgi:anti-sigma B factor antagonist
MSDPHACQVPTIEVRSPRPNTALVVLAGEHDLSSADELQRAFDQSLAGCHHLIVDLSPTEFIDSTIIAVLVQTMKNARELDRAFNVVLGTAPAVERVLDVTGVVPLLNVVPTVERALAEQADSATAARPAATVVVDSKPYLRSFRETTPDQCGLKRK